MRSERSGGSLTINQVSLVPSQNMENNSSSKEEESDEVPKGEAAPMATAHAVGFPVLVSLQKRESN